MFIYESFINFYFVNFYFYFKFFFPYAKFFLFSIFLHNLFLSSEFEKIPEELEPDVNTEAIELTILYMTKKHNHNIVSFLKDNEKQYYDFNDEKRYKKEVYAENDRFLNNELNPSKELDSTSQDYQFVFLPELLSALQQSIKVFDHKYSKIRQGNCLPHFFSSYSFLSLSLSLSLSLTLSLSLSPSPSLSLSVSFSTYYPPPSLHILFLSPF